MPESPLGLSRRQFDDAVTALADRQPVWHDGVGRWSDSLYVRLRGALRGSMKAGRHRVAGSHLPCHSAVLALLVDVDQTVAKWQPEGAGTVDRLRRLRVNKWRPQDVELIDSYTAQLKKLTVEAVELLGDKVEVALRMPCPSCGKKFVYRPAGKGDSPVRVWALRAGENGARCLGFNAAWEVDQLEFLATLLNCPPLPGS